MLKNTEKNCIFCNFLAATEMSAVCLFCLKNLEMFNSLSYNKNSKLSHMRSWNQNMAGTFARRWKMTETWMYKENWIQRRRRDPAHSYESCSVAHEAKKIDFLVWKYPDLPHCAAHRACALVTFAGRVGYFRFSPPANLNGDETIQSCGSSRLLKCDRTGWI